MFRFNRLQIRQIAEYLLPNPVVCSDGCKLDSCRALSVFLGRCALAGTLFQLQLLFGGDICFISLHSSNSCLILEGSTSAISQLIKTVKGILYNFALRAFRNFEWTRRRIQVLLGGTRALINSPIYAAIDGSGIRVSRASGLNGPFNMGQELDYNGYGQTHKIRVVGIFHFDGIGSTILGPYHGNSNDAAICVVENFYDRLKQFHEELVQDEVVRERPLIVGSIVCLFEIFCLFPIQEIWGLSALKI
jgi:hypothetical protein